MLPGFGRNPCALALMPKNERLWLADVGQNKIVRNHWIESGQNYG